MNRAEAGGPREVDKETSDSHTNTCHPSDPSHRSLASLPSTCIPVSGPPTTVRTPTTIPRRYSSSEEPTSFEESKFWKKQSPVKPGTPVMKQGNSFGLLSRTLSNTTPSSHHNNYQQPMGRGFRHGTIITNHHNVKHRRTNSTSFESFTASCEDAWDSNLEDTLVSNMSGMSCNNRVRTVSNSCSNKVPHSTPNKEMILPKQQNHDIKLPDQQQHLVEVEVETNTVSSPSSSSFNPNAVRKSIPGSASCLPRSGAKPATPPADPDPKLSKFKKLVYDDEVTDMNQLRSMSWSGIPQEVRHVTWKLLLGYLPVVKSRRNQVLESKRNDYDQLVSRYYNNMTPTSDEMWRQIHIDIPRMQPLISIFQQELVQKMFERILYIWSIRHPAAGYVQGMNDLVTPFFVTYLSEFTPGQAFKDVESFDVSFNGELDY